MDYIHDLLAEVQGKLPRQQLRLFDRKPLRPAVRKAAQQHEQGQPRVGIGARSVVAVVTGRDHEDAFAAFRLKRGQQVGEIDYSYFTEKGKNDIEMLINEPQKYYDKYVLKKKPAEKKKPDPVKKQLTLYEKLKKRIPKTIKDKIKKILGKN